MDWNEDGLKDLIVGEYNGTVRYYRNIGTVGNPQLTYEGFLLSNGITLNVGDYSVPWIDDWNEDGLKDLLVGESDGVVNLFTNVGTNANPVFGAGTLLTLQGGGMLDVGSRSGPNVIDMNGDGVKDLVSGEMYGKIYYFQNNGTNANPQLAAGQYVATGSVDIVTSGTARTAPVDWNDDGDMDLVAGSYDALLRLYIQTDNTPTMPTIALTNNGGMVIPGGGTLDFTIDVVNSTGETAVVDIWTEVQLPDYSFYGPIIARIDVPVDPYTTLSRDLLQTVPTTIPTGMYYYWGYTGDMEALQMYSQSSIYFYKTGDDDNVGTGSWNYTGWFDEDLVQVQVPETVSLSAAPNPFNPTTTVNFSLPEAGIVSLSVYNASGQQVTRLVDGYRVEGIHQATWDASGMPSGLYFIHMQTGDVNAVEKLILLK